MADAPIPQPQVNPQQPQDNTTEPEDTPLQIVPEAIPAEQQAADLARLVKSKEERHKKPGAPVEEGGTVEKDMPNPFRE